MKIAIASTAQFPTNRAYGLALTHTIRAMLDLGHEVIVVAPRLSEESALDPLVAAESTRVLDVSSPLIRFLHRRAGGPFGPYFFLVYRKLVARKVSLRVAKGNFDLLWTRDVLIASGVASTGISTVLEEHHLPSKAQARRYRSLRQRDPASLLLVGISEPIVGALRSLGFESRTVMLEISGVASHFLESTVREIARGSTFRIGYFGSGSVRGSDKGLSDLIRLTKSARNFFDAHLVIVGLTDSEAALIRREAETGGSDLAHVEFIPRLDHFQTPALMRTMNALAAPFPDTDELRATSPLKLLEYAATRKPILATDVPAVRNVLPADCYFQYAFGEDESFTRALSTIFLDPKLAHSTCNNAFALAREHEWARRTERILAELLRLPDKKKGEYNLEVVPSRVIDETGVHQNASKFWLL